MVRGSLRRQFPHRQNPRPIYRVCWSGWKRCRRAFCIAMGATILNSVATTTTPMLRPSQHESRSPPRNVRWQAAQAPPARVISLLPPCFTSSSLFLLLDLGILVIQNEKMNGNPLDLPLVDPKVLKMVSNADPVSRSSWEQKREKGIRCESNMKDPNPNPRKEEKRRREYTGLTVGTTAGRGHAA